MKKILLFSHDPGGANALLPLIKHLSAYYKVDLFGKNHALKIFRKAGYTPRDITKNSVSTTFNNVNNFLSTNHYDLIITSTSVCDYTERFIWQSALKQKVFCIAILDQWMSYSLRFLKKHLSNSATNHSVANLIDTKKQNKHLILPNIIMVMDEFSQSEMEKEGFPKDQLLITGNPYFEYFANNHKYNIAQSINLIKQYDLKKYQKVFLFASEPITTIFGERKGMEIYGYTELTILYHIVDYIKSQPSESIKLLIKPHPKDNIEVFSSLISQYSFISFSEEISTNYFDLLNTCDLVLGMSSTLLLEAALLNKNILSVQIGLIMDSPFVLDKMGISASVKSTVELTRKLDAMNDGSLRVNLLSYLTEHSVNNILQYINKMLK